MIGKLQTTKKELQTTKKEISPFFLVKSQNFIPVNYIPAIL